MKNRLPDYRTIAQQNGQPSAPAFEELRKSVHKQFASRLRQVESFVQEHPVTSIGAASCIGVFLGWVIKRR